LAVFVEEHQVVQVDRREPHRHGELVLRSLDQEHGQAEAGETDRRVELTDDRSRWGCRREPIASLAFRPENRLGIRIAQLSQPSFPLSLGSARLPDLG
jgi:hypothetical protein